MTVIGEQAQAQYPHVLIMTCPGGQPESIAAQLGFLGVRTHAAHGESLTQALSLEPAPMALVLVAAPGDDLTAQIAEAALCRPTLPIVIHQADTEPTSHPQVVAQLAPTCTYVEVSAVARELQLIHLQGGLEAENTRSELCRSLVGRSPGIQAVRTLIQRVAPSEASVLLRGETGTGKEVVARNIHYHSARRAGPFVPVNCGAIPAELLESELFGHEKGAFTGALTTRKGRFELANGGTLFLDEIGDMPLDMQVKILRVLQERRFERLGSATSLTADVRIVAATHRDLEAMIAEGTFREDLYYRLNVVPIEVPPLRERPEDLPLLIAEFNALLQRNSSVGARFGDAAMRALSRHQWPGNVRELANLVERCAILAPNGEVGLAELPAAIRALGAAAHAAANAGEGQSADFAERTASAPFNLDAFVTPTLAGAGVELKSLLDGLEVRLIRQALAESNGVVAQAANLLGLRRTTLVEKLRKFGIERDDAPQPELASGF